MRSIPWSVLSAVVVAAGAAVIGLSCARTPETDTATASDSLAADPVARGEYLSVIGGCNDCHTPGTFYGAPDMARKLSGSEIGWQGPWGTSYARNLTPDVETGIGSWTEEQIIAAVRTGTRPDGSRIQPPMPWPNYARLTDEDAQALAQYLKSIPAVKHMSPATLPPGQKAKTPTIPIPPPGEWDAPAQGGGSASAGEQLPKTGGGA
jgi:mono/diheme cytochrome c family protein